MILERAPYVRWGASRQIIVPPASTSTVAQFVDVAVGPPAAFEVAFYATSIPPVMGLSVSFVLRIGLGSTNHEERFSVGVQDAALQAPTVLRRPGESFQVEAFLFNSLIESRIIDIAVLVAPVTMSAEIAGVQCR